MTKEEFLRIRNDYGLSQQAMSSRLGKSLTTVRDWEKGRVPIDPLTADGIKFRFGITEREYVERYQAIN